MFPNALPLNIKICRNDTKDSNPAFKEYIHAHFSYCEREFTSIYKKCTRYLPSPAIDCIIGSDDIWLWRQDGCQRNSHPRQLYFRDKVSYIISMVYHSSTLLRALIQGEMVVVLVSGDSWDVNQRHVITIWQLSFRGDYVWSSLFSVSHYTIAVISTSVCLLVATIE